MKIAKNMVATIDYVLKNDSGEVLDTSEGQGPLSYIQGVGQILPGLEGALEGKTAGEKVNVSLTPQDGYGERNEGLVQKVERNHFEEADQLEIGMQFQIQSEAGPLIVTIVGLENEHVTLDGNHPLAGETLHFDVTVSNVREATEEEIAHGHVHGEGGHHH